MHENLNNHLYDTKLEDDINYWKLF
jgi:hypothetical protein